MLRMDCSNLCCNLDCCGREAERRQFTRNRFHLCLFFSRTSPVNGVVAKSPAALSKTMILWTSFGA